MKEQPSPTVVLNRMELHTTDTDLTPARSHRHHVTNHIDNNIESPNQSGLELYQQQNTPTNSNKLNRTTNDALNLTDHNVTGSGGRLSALRNWLKQTRWRRKDKSTPPGTPKHLGSSESPGQMRHGNSNQMANSPHGELVDSGSKSKGKAGKVKKNPANEFMSYKEKVM